MRHPDYEQSVLLVEILHAEIGDRRCSEVAVIFPNRLPEVLSDFRLCHFELLLTFDLYQKISAGEEGEMMASNS